MFALEARYWAISVVRDRVNSPFLSEIFLGNNFIYSEFVVNEILQASDLKSFTEF